MTKATQFKPEPYHTITPSIVVHDAAAAIAFYKQAFGAEELVRMPTDEGKIMHAEIRIGDSVVMLSDEFDFGVSSPKTLKGTTASLMIYVPDVDEVIRTAEAAGAKVIMPAQDMFWGDRFGRVADPFGHDWSIATHIEDLTPAEMEERQKKMMEQMK